MGMRITDLLGRAQPIAKELTSMGFNMVDVISLGILMLDGKDANQIGAMIKAMNAPPGSDALSKETLAERMVGESEADAEGLLGKRGRRKKVP